MPESVRPISDPLDRVPGGHAQEQREPDAERVAHATRELEALAVEAGDSRHDGPKRRRSAPLSWG
jgi:hypothetical protein